MPWGWTADLVRISLTVPSVNFPDRWSIFNTIETRKPGLTSARSVPLMLLIPLFLPSHHIENVKVYMQFMRNDYLNNTQSLNK